MRAARYLSLASGRNEWFPNMRPTSRARYYIRVPDNLCIRGVLRGILAEIARSRALGNFRNSPRERARAGEKVKYCRFVRAYIGMGKGVNGVSVDWKFVNHA